MTATTETLVNDHGTARRRQWGADRRAPLPYAPAPASHRSLGVNRAAIWVTIAAWAAYTARTLKVELVDRRPTWGTAVPMTVYLLVVAALTTSALAYLLARHGFLERSRHHVRATRMELDETFAGGMPSMTVLVPSYREEARVVRQTLLSAALQEHDDLSIVLLIDDPVDPSDDAARELLDSALALPAQVESLLAEPAMLARSWLATHDLRWSRRDGDEPVTSHELGWLSHHYVRAAACLREIGSTLPRVDHTDTFLVDHVLGRLVADFDSVANALRKAADEDAGMPNARVRQLYLRLVRVFSARLTSFQRKRFASLSHEPNKAMNLNSYLSLMGGRYRMALRAGEVHLDRLRGDEPDSEAELIVPSPEFVLTLDADSVLLPEYCLRLVHLMCQPGNEHIAVAQTPYSAFPGAPTRLERLAGASTDLQHRLHQGLTHYGATFWVGANAVLRRRALDDISTMHHEHGRAVVRYIQDRTVIEDTESSVDLRVQGWSLYNYGERLSYSATPPDFGALAIQRQRWADGGLLVLPKLLNYNREERAAGRPVPAAETFLRVNYLASIAWSSLGLILLLFYPFSETLLSPLVVLAAVPYFAAQAIDLKACGYRRRDVARIYGFNLVLLCVNLAGAVRSVGQAVTGSKIAFARTPKRQNRTAARPLFILAPALLIAFSAFTVYQDIGERRWWHAAFAGVNALTAAWAVVALIGVGAAVTDVVAGTFRFVYRAPEPTPVRRPATDWAVVLDRGAH